MSLLEAEIGRATSGSAGTISVYPGLDPGPGAAERSFVSSLSTNPSLPREFEHPALQELVLRGRTHGSVDAESFRAACESADVSDAKRL